MTAARPVVVDTMAVSALVNEQRDPDTARSYRQVVADRPVLVSFVTVAEMRYGALKAGWGDLRSRALERSLSQLVVVQPDDELIRACASLRAGCERAGHPLGQKGLPRVWLTSLTPGAAGREGCPDAQEVPSRVQARRGACRAAG